MTPEQPTAQQLAHNDQVLADINARLDALIKVHRTALADGDMHPQVALAGFAGYLDMHSDAASLADFLVVAIDRLARESRQTTIPGPPLVTPPRWDGTRGEPT